MATTDLTVRTQKLTRDKLASFLPNHELIKALENLTADVSVTIPDLVAIAKAIAEEALAAVEVLEALPYIETSTNLTTPNARSLAVKPALLLTDGGPGGAVTVDLNLDHVNAFTKNQSATQFALTDAVSVQVDASQSSSFQLLLKSAVGGTRLLANPTNLTAGMLLAFEFVQPATGGPCALTYDTLYDFGPSGAPLLTTTANARDPMLGYFDGAKIVCVVRSSGGGLTAIADKTLLANISGALAIPVGSTLSAILDNILGSTQGQLITRNVSNWTVLNPGASGSFLQSQGAGANLAYAAGLANPMTTAGDIIVGGVAGAPARLGIGANGTFLSIVTGAEAWVAAPAGGTKTYASFMAMDSQPPSAFFATLDVQGDIAVVSHPAAAVSSAFYQGLIPQGASLGSGLVVNIKWAAAAITGNVIWSVAFERMNTALGVNSYDTAVTATVATNGVTLVPTTTSITVATIDGLTAGDAFRVTVQRNGTTGTDTMLGPGLVFSVDVQAP